MEIIEKRLDELKPYNRNPRKNDQAVDAVAASIKAFGFKVPIVIDRDGVIVCGHTRLKAAKKLGLESVPCVVADDLTEEQIKAFRLADNKVSELAEWDIPALDLELADIDFDMAQFGFDHLLDDDYTNPDEVKEDDFDEEPPTEPKAKRGDIYLLGNHRLMCGDSTSAEDVANLMGEGTANLCVTDPPYGVDYKGIANDSRDGLCGLLDAAFKNMQSFSEEGASVYCFHSDRCADIFNNVFRKYCHFSSMIIWEKQKITLSQTDYQSIHEPCLYGWFNNGNHKFYGDRKQKSVWQYDRDSISEHTTPKPVALIAKAIFNSSQDKESVFDPFGGSGSTLIACEQTGRKCYMMELEPKYVDVIIDRWEKFTGRKAEKI